MKYFASKIYEVDLPPVDHPAYASLVDAYVQFTTEDNSDAVAFMREPGLLANELAQVVDAGTEPLTAMLIGRKIVTEFPVWETQEEM